MSLEVIEQPGVREAIREEVRRVVREELSLNDPAARRLFGKPATAEFLGTSVKNIERLAGRRELPFVMVGTRMKFAVGDLIAFQRRHTTPATAK